MVARRQAPTSLAKERKRRETERQRKAADAQRLIEHQARIETANVIAATGAVPGVKRVRKKPFDPEAGRYRMARAMPGAKSYDGMPTDAPHECPSCGASLPGYHGKGRYRCAVDRLAKKRYGCGYRWIGPSRRNEAPLSSSESTQWATVDSESSHSVSDAQDEYDEIFT